MKAVKTNTLDFFRMPLEAIVAPFAGIDMAVRIADGPDDIDEVFFSHHHFRDIYESRYAAGHRAIIASLSGQPAHIAWIATGKLRIDELAYTWQLSEGIVCLYDCRTLEPMRGRGAYPSTLRWISDHCSAQRIIGIWIYCEPGNIASVRGIEKAGFELIGKAAAMFFLGMCVQRRWDKRLRECL